MAEDNSFRPINPYGATKAASEGLFYSNHHNTKIPLKICRMHPIYGPRGRNDMFVKRILNSIITGKEIQKYGTGEGVRDYTYVKDAVDGIFSIDERDLIKVILKKGKEKLKPMHTYLQRELNVLK